MRTLKHGDNGPEVQTLQLGLNRAGANLTIDGSYGSVTTQAVKNFQENHLLDADGVCGKRTWEALAPYIQDYSCIKDAVEECVAAIQKLPEFKRLEAFFNG